MNNQFDNNNVSASAQGEKTKKTESVKAIDIPNRKLPVLIDEIIEKGFSVSLVKNGYYIEGFYGINSSKDSNKLGFAFCQDSTEENSFIFLDAKGHKHIIKSFKDLVVFNSVVWSYFYKISDLYKKPDSKWFPYMLELDVLNITPGK